LELNDLRVQVVVRDAVRDGDGAGGKLAELGERPLSRHDRLGPSARGDLPVNTIFRVLGRQTAVNPI